jgi:outer membrane receptor for ferrienterochelin and colicin
MKIRFIRFILLMLILSTMVFAGNTGKISGKILDAKTKEPLVGVNVVVVGTSLGASTNIDGEFSIINISPNVYSIRASLLGYDPVFVSNIKVSIDLTTRQDFILNESVVEQKEVVIVAERPVIQKDITATTSIVSKELISQLAVTEVRDVIKLQAGMAVSSDGQFHLRGGRSGQISYQIDGVTVTDAYDNSNTLDVGANAIQEVQVISGAFNAEYGQAMSGVVNIITKDGGDALSGNFTTYTGSYLSNKRDIFWNISNTSPVSVRSFEGSLSGPIISDKLTFYANGRYFKNDGYLFGHRLFLTTDLSVQEPGSGGSNFIISKNGDGKYISMNPNTRSFLQGKLSYRFLPNLKVAYNYMLDKQEYQDYDHGNRLTPDNNLHRFRKTHSNIFSINHAISNSTFYNLSLSYLFKDYRHYLYENLYTGDPFRPTSYVDNRLLQTPPYSFNIGGTNTNRFIRNTGSYSAKLDWTTQINERISIQTGSEFKQHNIFYQNINLIPLLDDRGQQVSPFNVDIPPITSQDFDEYLHKPYEVAVYAQSKFETNSLIFNFGVRFDAFNPDGRILNDPTDPDIRNPVIPWHKADALSQREKYWYKKASVKYQWSPRLGLAFPISVGGVVHFSYGHFFQLPSYELLYTNPEFKLGVGSGNQGLFGNADLKPQKTVKGEIGLKQQISDDIAADVTMFFEDFRNLTGTQTDDILIFTNERSYSRYANSDFGSSKGIVLKFDKRFSNGLAASLDYTFSITQGNASNPADARNAKLGGATAETYIAPLDWDQRHSINLVVAYSMAKNFGASLICNYYSGQPYTPDVNKNSTIKKNSYPRNSAFRPSIFNIDLKANKDFSFGDFNLSIFVRVFNLLDLENARTVYGNSGDPLFTFDKLAAENARAKTYYNSLDELYTNPGFFSEPRRIELGTSISF